LATLILGLTGAISFHTAHFENSHEQTELGFSRQAAHLQYIEGISSLRQ